jgi:hypothetical protein
MLMSSVDRKKGIKKPTGTRTPFFVASPAVSRSPVLPFSSPVIVIVVNAVGATAVVGDGRSNIICKLTLVQ